MKVSANKSVAAEYELFVDGEKEGELELMERATRETPLSFIYGVGMMLPKFEEYLFGLQAGDKFDFTISNEDAYGPYDDESVVELERSIFEVDGKIDEKVIFEGNVVPMMDNMGNRMNAQIVTISDSNITIDLNHPLAGETLHFKGSVIEVREPSEEELAALTGGGCGCGCGHEHGDEGGCGCGGDHECECGSDEKGGCGCGCN